MKTKLSLCLNGLAMLAALLAPMRVALAQPAAKKTSGEYLFYVGTYTGPKSKGIYAYRFQPANGTISPLGAVGETPSPSFLAIHPNRQVLYAVNEHDGDEKIQTVSAFAIDQATGQLAFLNKVSSRGSGPCHLVVDKTGKYVIIANYGSGSVAVLPIQKDGRLGEATAFIQHEGSSIDPARQKGPHAHCIALSPDNRFVFVADLGLDKVLIYRFNALKGTLTPNNPAFAKVKAGSGPRHLAFHPNGKFFYVNSEMGSLVTVFTYGPTAGTLREIQTVSTLPEGFSGQSTTAEIQVDRAGKFLYVSNRGHDSIAVFAINPVKGTLTPVEHVPTQGKTPRNFSLDPTGAYLLAANQNTDNTVLFRVDAKTGRLTPAGQTLTDAGSPVCIVFLPAR